MHTQGRAPSANRAPEERETSRRPADRALRSATTAPLAAQNVLALQRAIGNAAVSRLVDAEQHAHGPDRGHSAAAAATPAAAAPVQRVKTEEERGSHLRRIEMAETAAGQLAAGVNAALADHLFEGHPITGGVDRNAPQGLHAYSANGSLPDGIETVGTGAGNKDKVHVITWKYRQAQATKRSTMFPRWMPRNHVLALVALRQGADVRELPVNKSKNVRSGETKPVSAQEIRTHVLRGVEINLQMVSETVYPSHAAY